MDRERRTERLEVPLAVAAGGALGALARWGLALAWDGQVTATLLANVSGSFALGIVLVVGEIVGPRHSHVAARLWRPFMATGVLGGFTTFSTLAFEAFTRDFAVAAVYLATSIGGGLAAYALGNAFARRAFGVRA